MYRVALIVVEKDPQVVIFMEEVLLGALHGCKMAACFLGSYSFLTKLLIVFLSHDLVSRSCVCVCAIVHKFSSRLWSSDSCSCSLFTQLFSSVIVLKKRVYIEYMWICSVNGVWFRASCSIT